MLARRPIHRSTAAGYKYPMSEDSQLSTSKSHNEANHGSDEARGSAHNQGRRRFLSVPLIVERVAPEEGRGTFFGYAKNISHSGMFISSTSPRELGSRYQLSVPLPQPLDRTMHCTCEVIWRRPWPGKSPLEPGMGLRFVDLSAEVRDAIDHWIEDSWRTESRVGRPLLEGFRDRASSSWREGDEPHHSEGI